jgi:VanZ family protein
MIHFLMNLIESKWIGITLFTLAAITTLSLWPHERLPSVPGTDKTHHMIAYALLMLPTALRKPNKWMLIGLFFIAYSGLIELLQPYVNRYGDWLDMAANATGVLVGLVVAEIFRYTLKRFR